MSNTASKSIHARGFKRNIGLLGATVALLALALPLASGCDDTSSATFRAAAMSSIQSGLNSILQGLLNGAFAVAQADMNTDGTSASTSGTNTTGNGTGTTGTNGTSGTGA